MGVRPKLILGSFRGIGGVRIQTYTLNAEVPQARAVLVHGSRCHFTSEFLTSEHMLSNINKSDHCDMLKNQHDISANISTNIQDAADELINTVKYKNIGKLKLEDATIDLYEDGTNGWEIQDTYLYEDTFCHVLNKNNITVHGMDLRSYGRSESPSVFIAGKVRGLVDNCDYMAQDVITFIEKIKKESPENIPIYAIGFSMGGGVVSRVAELSGDRKLADGIILLSPMLSILTEKLEKIIHGTWYLHEIASKLFPRIEIASGERPIDTSLVEWIRNKDPLCSNAGIPYRTGYGMIKLIDTIQRDSLKIHPDTSVLVIHSLADVVCFYRGSENFYNSLTHIKERRFITLDNIDHMILNPPMCLQVAKYASDWIFTRNPDFNLDYQDNIRDN